MRTSITTGPGHGERAPLNPFAQRYHVYHLYDAAGVLLYVGRSCQPLARLKAHRAKAGWASRVAEIEGHGPYTWGEAVQRERADILRMKPAHNIDGVVRNTGRKVEVA
jgi:hypothetical protein